MNPEETINQITQENKNNNEKKELEHRVSKFGTWIQLDHFDIDINTISAIQRVKEIKIQENNIEKTYFKFSVFSHDREFSWYFEKDQLEDALKFQERVYSIIGTVKGWC